MRSAVCNKARLSSSGEYEYDMYGDEYNKKNEEPPKDASFDNGNILSLRTG